MTARPAKDCEGLYFFTKGTGVVALLIYVKFCHIRGETG